MTDSVVLNKVTVAGREITCKPMSAGQLVMLKRLVAKLRGDIKQEPGTALDVFGKIIDVAEVLIVNEGDRSYVEEMLLTGVIDVQDMLKIISGGSDEDDPEPADDEKPVRAKAPASLAGKKAAAAKRAPAKTANPRRATR